MISPHKGISALQKPEKIYLESTNLAYALAPNRVNRGSLRETFLLNQLRAPQFTVPLAPIVYYPKQGDFLVDTYEEQVHLEVGGSGKGFRQLLDTGRSFVVADDIEIGFDRKIPLWLFGFLY